MTFLKYAKVFFQYQMCAVGWYKLFDFPTKL